jgi:enterochelin esterase-like enzyme
MKKQIAKCALILLILNHYLLCNSQQDYFTTEFDAGKVILNSIVPNANSVKILGAGGSWGLYNLDKSFTKNSDSAWQAILDPTQIKYITPGFYYYGFQVNGVNTFNPNEKVYINISGISGIEIPDPENDFYDIKDVPHGTIRSQIYYSTYTKKYRQFFIYLPPSYDTKSDEKYPVLFLQHGMGETEYCWHMQGKVNFIIDNLIAEGKALPMIVVMENGMTVMNYSAVAQKDLIPFLEKNYKVKTDRMNMAAAGLSMGSFQVTALSLFYSNRFAYVGTFCGGSDFPASWIKKKCNDSIEVLFNGYGLSDETNLGQNFEARLNNGEINHIKAVFPGGHEWQVWRKCLHQFAPLLFKPYTYDKPFSVKNNKSQNTFSVYPNPFTDHIQMQFNNDEDQIDTRYELSDIAGKKILWYVGNKKHAEVIISKVLQSNSSKIFILSVYTSKNVYKVKLLNNP